MGNLHHWLLVVDNATAIDSNLPEQSRHCVRRLPSSPDQHRRSPAPSSGFRLRHLYNPPAPIANSMPPPCRLLVIIAIRIRFSSHINDFDGQPHPANGTMVTVAVDPTIPWGNTAPAQSHAPLMKARQGILSAFIRSKGSTASLPCS